MKPMAPDARPPPAIDAHRRARCDRARRRRHGRRRRRPQGIRRQDRQGEGTEARDPRRSDRPLGEGRAGGQRESYRKRAVAAVRYAFKPLMRTPAADLTGEMVEATLDKAITRGPAAARMAGVSLRTLLRWAVSKRVIATVPTFASRQDRRARAGAERGRAAPPLPGRRDPPRPAREAVPAGDADRLRRSEIGELRWSEVHHLDDPALAELRLPSSRTKTAAGHWVPLSAEARNILLAVPRTEGETFVFPGAKGATHLDDWHRLKQERTRRSASPRWSRGSSTTCDDRW